MGASILNLKHAFIYFGALNAIILFSSVNALDNMHLFQKKCCFVGLVDCNS